MRSLKDKYLGTVPIRDEDYKIDLTLSDKYQSFSAELLRLALLGLAVIGFIITNVVMKLNAANAQAFYRSFQSNKWLLVSAVITLVLSAGCAMAHRYFATDSLTHFVRKLRLMRRLDELKAMPDNEQDSERIMHYSRLVEQEKDSFDADLSRSGRWIAGSVICLLIGMVCVLSGVGLLMYEFLPQIR